MLNKVIGGGLLGGEGDTDPPEGYDVEWVTDPVTGSNHNATEFQITGAEVGADFDYEITSDAGGTPVTGSGTIATATQSVTGVNVTSLNDGTLTVTLTLTDPAGNEGDEVTDTVTYDSTAPDGYAVAWVTDPVTSENDDSVEFQITGAEVGADYDYEITSDGGGTAVTGSGTIGSATENISGVDVSGLNTGTLTVGVILTDSLGNEGDEVFDTVEKRAFSNDLTNQMYTTETADLEVMYLGDESETVAQNTGLTDYSDNDRTGTHFDSADPDFNDNLFQQTGIGNIDAAIDITGGDGPPGLWYGDIGAIGLPSAFTMIGFAAPDKTGFTAFLSLCEPGGTIGTNMLHLRTRDTGSFQLVAQPAGGGSTVMAEVNDAGVRNDGTWHMVAATWDGTTAKLYLDGSPLTLDSSATPSGTFGWDTFVTYGRISATNVADDIVGLCGPVAFWTTDLTAQQISDIWDASEVGA